MNNSIRKKVIKWYLLVSVPAVLLVGIVAAVSILSIRRRAVDISEVLGNSAATDSKYALEVQTRDMLQTLADDKAQISNSKLKIRENYVSMMADYATAIMVSPDEYPPLPIDPPDPSNKGIIVAQLHMGESVNPQEVQDEALLISNNQKLLTAIVGNNENIRSAYIGTQTGVFITVDRDSDQKTAIFEPRERPWYQLALKNNSISWTDVYDDANGRGLAITCAAPYHNADGEIMGVVGIGGPLDDLTDEIIGLKIGESGYAFVLNEYGQMIISPTIRRDDDGKLVRENLVESENPQLRAIAQRMTRQERGIDTVIMDGRQYFIAYAPFETMPWSIATVISVDEAIKLAVESQENITHLKESALSGIDAGVKATAGLFALIIAVIAIAVVFTAGRMGVRLTDPIVALTEDARKIGGGDLSHKLNVHTGDEIETLAHTFNKMISDIKTITGEKERIGAELNVATKIQASMLPSIFPPFPERSELDIFASMLPAKEVGGDFYDFFLVDEDNLAIVIADVSGKGVPAALFMVIAKTLIKNSAQYGNSPKEVFRAVNNLLCENNEAQMFVTAFMGYLHIPTGRFSFVNAGHNPPLIARKGEGYTWIKQKRGFVLAGMEDINYTQDEIYLSQGDTVFLYTDGVTEAVNRESVLFGEEALRNAANASLGSGLDELLHTIKLEIDRFADGAEQADDITMLALRYEGGSDL